MHRRRAEVIDALTADCLLFDDSPAGERLRRYELANGRAVWRSLDALHKHRSATERNDKTETDGAISNGLSSVVSGPLSVVNCEVDAVDAANAPNEPTGACESAPNEPTVTRENAPNEPTVPRENAPNEPTGVRQNAPNEPTAVGRNAPNEPTVARENVTNEPTVACEIVTNEPTSGPLSVVSCPLPIASCNVEAVDEANAPNEPTAVRENATNEPTAVWENVTNEPTMAHENATNEPTSGRLSVVSCPLPVKSYASYVGHGSAPNEPTAARESRDERSHRGLGKRPIQATLAGTLGTAGSSWEGEPPCGPSADAGSDGTSPSQTQSRGSHSAVYSKRGESAERSAGADNRDDKNFEEGFTVQQTESILKACEKIRVAGTEEVRKLNEEARREAEAAMAISGFRLREQNSKNGRPAGQPKVRSTQTGQITKKKAAVPNPTELEPFVKTSLAEGHGAYPPSDGPAHFGGPNAIICQNDSHRDSPAQR